MDFRFFFSPQTCRHYGTTVGVVKKVDSFFPLPDISFLRFFVFVFVYRARIYFFICPNCSLAVLIKYRYEYYVHNNNKMSLCYYHRKPD